ncbi:MAG TPA: PSD1 and planctomycete cytochrome C domain-containing protein [Verrucomicrobiae bacterium]|nr:PSD1 and planctomycete cytochrome C domain-containing protein [Verrucomicrobiae bacterium]
MAGIPGGVFGATPAGDSAGLEFFEKHVRPVLVEHCYKCHSAESEKLRGSLHLDTREGILKGGDSGPAIVPGDPDKSLLIKAVRHASEDLKMPFKNPKLPDEAIEELAAWIRMGAPDPRTEQAQGTKSTEARRLHWAFQPVREPAPPSVRNKRLVQTPVDNFLLAELQEHGLTYSPRADKRTLLRRVTYDLTGLPPTPEEARAFEADDSASAFARVVDRLLDSPRYGERWARYWLDIARYADTKGYVFEEERRYPYSYTYRDWVIRAFNEDLPYDQFLIQQLAADRLALGDDKRPLAALGFLTLGRRFLNNPNDIIDDRIDVVTRGTMGLTVACARCHDHKYDPIPSADYYSLYGVFASSHEPADKPLLGNVAMPKEHAAYVEERQKREQELVEYRETKRQEVLTKLRSQVGDYLLAVHDADQASDDKKENVVRERKLQPALARQYRRALQDWREKPNAIFSPWLALADLPATNFTARARELCAGFGRPVGGSNQLNAEVVALFAPERAPASLKEVAERYNTLFGGVDREWRDQQTNALKPAVLAPASREELRQFLYASSSPVMSLDADELRRFTDTPTQQKLRALQRKVEELDAVHPGAPPRAMALVDNTTPTEPVIFRRGNPNTPGAKVPRQFLSVIAGPQRHPFQEGSGRLEMAQAIASPDNPLTARVFVNRVWSYHFGAPFVRTPSDFGVRSDPPTHPKLLDYLAARLVAEGWSIKKLHKLIVLSSGYQQSSEDNPKAARVDPGNQWFWRMNRRRLDFEALRDSLLAVSGRIDFTAGGRGVDITTEPFTGRRTVYGFVERQNLPGIFRTFDFASPDTTSPQRFSTTVPQQALFLMNSPFVVHQARGLMDRPEVKELADANARIRKLYQLAFQRAPDADELQLARRFLESQAEPNEPDRDVWAYGYGRFEADRGQVVEFTPLPHWTGYAWQGGTNLPDAKLGWVILNAEGGHVGNDQNHAAIRRWRAPFTGSVRISGELNHPSEKGDGVRARIVSSERGLLGEWTARHDRTETLLASVNVQRGERIDFVVDCRETVEFDSFHWAPLLQRLTPAGAKPAVNPEEPTEWSAKADFSGPPRPKEKRSLSAWEKYAQVLLLSNELAFVD